MKFIASILLALFLTACLSASVSAIQDPNSVSLGPGESLADKLIEASNSPGVLKTSTGFAPTPEASKKEWANRTGVDFTMPESLSASGNSAKESRAAAEASGSEDAASADETQTSTTEDTSTTEQSTAEDTSGVQSDASSSDAAGVGGSWLFTLEDGAAKEMVLTLFQSGDAVFGTGSINEGDDTLVVAASGVVDDETMYLDITSIGTIGLYRMALDLDGDLASGDYDAFAASGETWTGTASGERSVPQ